CMEHYKTLPMFLGRGFETKDFTADFHIKIMEQDELDKLAKTYIKNGIYDGTAVQTFIRKFFSTKANNNTRYDHAPYFTALLNLDANLYGILERFWEDWLTFKIGNPQQEYQTMLETFLAEIKEWKKNKTLIY